MPGLTDIARHVFDTLSEPSILGLHSMASHMDNVAGSICHVSMTWRVAYATCRCRGG